MHYFCYRVAKFYYATPELMKKAISESLSVREKWERVPLQEKFNMWLKVPRKFTFFFFPRPSDHFNTMVSFIAKSFSKSIFFFFISCFYNSFYAFYSFKFLLLVRMSITCPRVKTTQNSSLYLSMSGGRIKCWYHIVCRKEYVHWAPKWHKIRWIW